MAVPGSDSDDDARAHASKQQHVGDDSPGSPVESLSGLLALAEADEARAADDSCAAVAELVALAERAAALPSHPIAGSAEEAETDAVFASLRGCHAELDADARDVGRRPSRPPRALRRRAREGLSPRRGRRGARGDPSGRGVVRRRRRDRDERRGGRASASMSLEDIKSRRRVLPVAGDIASAARREKDA